MDVEGYESHVIAGAAHTLAGRDLLAVLSESDAPSVCEPLRDRGFLRYAYDAFSRRLEPAPKAVKAGVGNHLFVRDAAEIRKILIEAPRRVVVGVEF